MEDEKLVLHNVTSGDTSLKEYLKKDADMLDVKLVHTVGPRNPNTWTAVAIKFKRLSQEKLLEKVVSLRADEYWGKSNGYHIFWWD